MRIPYRQLAPMLLATVASAFLVACGSDDRPAGQTVDGEGARAGRATTTASASHAVRTNAAMLAVVRQLSTAEQAGQLIMTKLEGQSLSPADRAAIERQHLGGVILFGYNYSSREQLRDMLVDVQRAGQAGNRKHVGMLVSIDQEGGAIRRLADLPPEESQVQLAAVGDIAAARRAGASAGRALGSVGINLNLAPVADLALPPERTMAHRSFGADPDQVGRFVGAAVLGIEGAGVSAAVKHFPGFGGATANSDDAVARVTRSRAELNDDLVPFAAAVAADVDAVMVSHAIYPALGATLPATIAPQVIEPILRNQLGYEGVAMTDSMNAKGLRGAWRGTVPQACVEAVVNGIDLVLLTGSMETARLCRQRIVDAVESGRISQERLETAVLRVLELKRKHQLVALPR